jgi:lipoprotein-releasing system permease protein
MASSPQSATRPFSSFEWMIAMRYLRAKRQESMISVISVISLIGIALGVATLITVLSVMNGFRAELLGRILGLNGHMYVQSLTGSLTDHDAIVARIRAIPGVVSAAPVVEGQGLASKPDGSASVGVLVRGLRPDDVETLTAVSSTLSPGTMEEFRQADRVIIGAGLLESLELQIGDTVRLLAPEGDVTPFGTTPRMKTYLIGGTFRVGVSEYDRLFVFMPLDEAQLFFNLPETDVHRVEIMVNDPDRVVDWRDEVIMAAGNLTRVVNWQQINNPFFDILQVERVMMFIILTLIILVAALNIISGLVMLVKEKGPDIAILRTMGTPRGSIMRVFLIAGISISVVGVMVGVIVAIVFCANIESIRLFASGLLGVTLFPPEIYFLSQLPAQLNPYDVIAVIVMALSLSFLATLYPAWRAARLDPVEALRYE